MQIQVLEIKKSELVLVSHVMGLIDEVVYLYLVNYGRARPEEVIGALNGFLSVRQ